MARSLQLKKEYTTPDGRKIIKFITIGGKHVPIAEEKPAIEKKFKCSSFS